MERLTFKFGDKYAVKCTDVNENTYYDKNCKNAESYYQGKAIDKLAHYEDLEEKGLLIELPCNVGDSVYFIKSYFSYCKEPIEEKVDRIIITNIVTFKTENRTFCLNDIGTKVFLTKSEAEQALAEMEKNEQI